MNTDAMPAGHASGWVAECVSALLLRHGVSARHQATEIAQICAISVSQARRKLRGAVWLFGEVVALCRHYGASLDVVFAPHALQGLTDHGHAGALSAADNHAGLPATLLADELRLACHVHLGAQCHSPLPSAGTDLLAALQDNDWLVASASRIQAMPNLAACFRVEHLQLDLSDDQPRLRIAVLDDDALAAQTLVDWFTEMGFDAQPFTAAEALVGAVQDDTLFDAYVVDLILSDGQTSQSVVEHIRQLQPQAPIVLLTGQLRDGTASESTLATMLRTHAVTFFEKPVRPAVLTAAIQSSLDRLQSVP